MKIIMYLRNYFAKIACRYYYVSFLSRNENHCRTKKKKLLVIKIILRYVLRGKVSRYIDASMNRATPSSFV